MSKHKNIEAQPRKLSKRARRNRFIVFIMIIAMLLSTLTAGLASIL